MAKVSDFWANYLEAVDMAAIASAEWRGLGKKNDADAAAVEAMRKSFDKVPFDGRVAIGEGERDRHSCCLRPLAVASCLPCDHVFMETTW